MTTADGATAVGVRAADGVVLGATARVTEDGAVTGTVRRVEQVHERGAVAVVGPVGDAQAFVRALEAEADRRRLADRPLTARGLATRAGDLAAEHGVDALLAVFTPEAEATLFVADAGGGVTSDDRAAIGGGGDVALGVLETESPASLADATDLVRTALAAVAERTAGGGAEADLAVVDSAGVEIDRIA